MKSLLGKY